MHVITNIDFGQKDPTFICIQCRDWETKDLTEVAKHAVENQFEVKAKNEHHSSGIVLGR